MTIPLRYPGYITAIASILTIVSAAQAKYSGGTGEPNDPYQIATAEDLMLLGETPEDYDKHFILTADIDLDPNLPGRKIFDKAVIAPDVNDANSEFDGTPFSGVFDGNGHTISHLTMTGASYLGLFGQMASDAAIRDLGVVGANITGSGDYVGGLVGDNSGAVVRCYTCGVVVGESKVGVLMGRNFWGGATQCYSTSTVSGDYYVGGLAGYNDERGRVWCGYSAGRVSGTRLVGGLVGESLIGDEPRYSGSVTYSFWDTQTSGQATSAGGAGLTTAQMEDPNTFMAAGWDFVGQADGPHDVWAEPPGGGYPVLCWQLPAGYGLPHFSGGTGEPNDPYLVSMARELNGIGYNSRLMRCHFKMAADLDLAGVDFYTIADYECPYSGVFDGNGKTIRNISHTLFGCVTGLIKDLRLLNPNCGRSPVEGNYGTIASCSVEGGRVLGRGGLVGTNSGTVTQCYSTAAVSHMNPSEVGGLVGCNGGTVTQCHSTGPVNGTGYVGGLVGDNRGFVSQCFSTGVVTGDYNVGGLAGDSWYGYMTACYSSGLVMGSRKVGGLAGGNFYGRVTNCYSTATVDGDDCVGGLVGANWGTPWSGGTLTNCYATGGVCGDTSVGGLVGTNDCPLDDLPCSARVANCFWDTDTTGLTSMCGSQGGGAAGCNDFFGKATAKMRIASTFLEAGWDFVGETANGTEDIWWILEGQDYPRLWWEAHD